MNKEEYYNRVKKTRSKVMTDRMSVDEEYKMICQINYLNNQYIKTLEQALDEIEKYIEKHKHLNWYVESCYKDNLLQIIKKAKGE